MSRMIEFGNGLKSIFRPKKISKIWRKEAGFCAIIIVPLVLHWIILGLIPQIDSILQSFREYDPLTDTYSWLPEGHIFDNYKRWFQMVFADKTVAGYIFNGYKLWSVGFLLGFLNIFVCFVIGRKCIFHKFFTNVMLIPGIIGGFTILLVFQFFMEKALPVYAFDLFGLTVPWDLISNEKTALATSMVYTAFVGFPGALLTYVGIFNRIPSDLIEYGQLEGLTFWGEFKYLGWPTIYPMWYLSNLTILTAGLTYMGPGFELFSGDAYSHGLATFGYHVYIITRFGENGMEQANYCFSAASSLIIGVVSIISAVAGRKLLSMGDKEVVF